MSKAISPDPLLSPPCWWCICLFQAACFITASVDLQFMQQAWSIECDFLSFVLETKQRAKPLAAVELRGEGCGWSCLFLRHTAKTLNHNLLVGINRMCCWGAAETNHEMVVYFLSTWYLTCTTEKHVETYLHLLIYIIVLLLLLLLLLPLGWIRKVAV